LPRGASTIRQIRAQSAILATAGRPPKPHADSLEARYTPRVRARIDLALVRGALEGRVADSVLHLDSTERRAAVAAVLRDGPTGAEVLLIRRATRQGDPWSGQMAFPGGQREPEDRDLLVTAIRETKEEIGLDLGANAKLIGCLESIQAIAKGRPIAMTITPFIFELVEEPPLSPNEEVAEVIWAPLAPLAHGELKTTFPYHHESGELNMPAWDVQGRIVWGLTYRMLNALLILLHDPGSKT
jgi:8-oxo-dGTP pyrophosphatase MutT (NUDIX family)